MESRIDVLRRDSAQLNCLCCSFTIVLTFVTISLLNISKLSDFYSSIKDSHGQSPLLHNSKTFPKKSDGLGFGISEIYGANIGDMKL